MFALGMSEHERKMSALLAELSQGRITPEEFVSRSEQALPDKDQDELLALFKRCRAASAFESWLELDRRQRLEREREELKVWADKVNTHFEVFEPSIDRLADKIALRMAAHRPADTLIYNEGTGRVEHSASGDVVSLEELAEHIKSLQRLLAYAKRKHGVV